jgi:hypothetical protein
MAEHASGFMGRHRSFKHDFSPVRMLVLSDEVRPLALIQIIFHYRMMSRICSHSGILKSGVAPCRDPMIELPLMGI